MGGRNKLLPPEDFTAPRFQVQKWKKEKPKQCWEERCVRPPISLYICAQYRGGGFSEVACIILCLARPPSAQYLCRMHQFILVRGRGIVSLTDGRTGRRVALTKGEDAFKNLRCVLLSRVGGSSKWIARPSENRIGRKGGKRNNSGAASNKFRAFACLLVESVFEINTNLSQWIMNHRRWFIVKNKSLFNRRSSQLELETRSSPRIVIIIIIIIIIIVLFTNWRDSGLKCSTELRRMQSKCSEDDLFEYFCRSIVNIAMTGQILKSEFWLQHNPPLATSFLVDFRL